MRLRQVPARTVNEASSIAGANQMWLVRSPRCRATNTASVRDFASESLQDRLDVVPHGLGGQEELPTDCVVRQPLVQEQRISCWRGVSSPLDEGVGVANSVAALGRPLRRTT